MPHHLSHTQRRAVTTFIDSFTQSLELAKTPWQLLLFKASFDVLRGRGAAAMRSYIKDSYKLTQAYTELKRIIAP